MSASGAAPFGEGLFVVEGDRVHMLGIPFDTRMTVAVLDDGGLWLHSPVPATPARVEAVEALGPIRHLIAPNKFHHLALASWQAVAPDARTWAERSLAERGLDLQCDEVLTDDVPAAWAGQIDQLAFEGSRVIREMVFCHRASRTLVVTDIVQNHDPEADGWFWRTVKRLNGIGAPNGGAPRDWILTVRDRDAARRCRDRMLAWDFDRLVLSHGLCLETGAHDFVERAFRWLDR